MTGSNQSIITLYEQEGLTPEQIAEAEGWDVMAVKSILMQSSLLYIERTKLKQEDGFTDAEEIAARKAIANIVMFGEDEHLKLRAAMYVRNDKKGRLDVVAAQKGLNINIAMINAGIQKALERANRSEQKVIELSPSESKLLAAAQAKIV